MNILHISLAVVTLGWIHCAAGLPVIEVLPVVAEGVAEDVAPPTKDQRQHSSNLDRQSRYDVRYAAPFPDRQRIRSGPAVRHSDYAKQHRNYPRHRGQAAHRGHGYGRRPLGAFELFLRPFGLTKGFLTGQY